MFRFSKPIIIILAFIMVLAFPARYSSATDLHLMLADLKNLIINLPDSSFVNPGVPNKHKNILSVEIKKVENLITKAEADTDAERQGKIYQKAIKFLEHMSIKTDGCINTNLPDNNDYISECQDQEQVHIAISDIIATIEQLILI